MSKYYKDIIQVVVIILLLFAGWRIYMMGEEMNRLSSNQQTLFKGIQLNQDSTIAVVGRLELTTSELLEKQPSIKEELKAIGVRMGQVESITKTGIKVQANLTAQVRDSIVKGDTLMKQLYSDKFIRFESLLNQKKDTAFVKVEMPVKLDQVVSRYKEGFFLFKPFKSWKYKQTIKSDNPYAKIEYSEYITIRK